MNIHDLKLSRINPRMIAKRGRYQTQQFCLIVLGRGIVASWSYHTAFLQRCIQMFKRKVMLASYIDARVQFLTWNLFRQFLFNLVETEFCQAILPNILFCMVNSIDFFRIFQPWVLRCPLIHLRSYRFEAGAHRLSKPSGAEILRNRFLVSKYQRFKPIRTIRYNRIYHTCLCLHITLISTSIAVAYISNDFNVYPNVERNDPSWVQTGRCEDAFFFSSKAAGVADGVGQMEQFSEYGVDAAKQLSPKKIACTCWPKKWLTKLRGGVSVDSKQPTRWSFHEATRSHDITCRLNYHLTGLKMTPWIFRWFPVASRPSHQAIKQRNSIPKTGFFIFYCICNWTQDAFDDWFPAKNQSHQSLLLDHLDPTFNV